MPRVVLNEVKVQTRVPLALVTVQAFPVVGATAVRVTAARGDSALPPPAVPPPPGVLVVSAGELDQVVVSVAPSAQANFPAGCRVTIVLEAGAYEVEVAGVDVAGLPGRDVLALGVEGGQLVVRALLEAGAAAQPLTPLGESVRVAVIDAVGAQRVPAGAAFDAGIVVDGSASFRRFLASGALARVLEVMTGLLSVTSVGRSVGVSVSGVPARSQTAVDPAAAAAQVLTMLDEAPLVVGSRLDDPALYSEDIVSYVITDAEPPERLPTARAHIVIIGDPSLEVDAVRGIPATLLDARTVEGDSATVAARLPTSTVARALLRGADAVESGSDERVSR